MKIDKVTFKNNQAWLAIRNDDGEYIGTFHVVNPELVKLIKLDLPEELELT